MSEDRIARGSVSEPARMAEAGSPAGCLIRLAWLLGGPIALAFGAVLLGDARQESPLAGHLLIGGTAGLMIGLRYLDVHHLGGQTANGEPATPQHFRRYAITIAVIAGLIWGAAMWWRS
ncbi:MAG: hypothetical protein JW751_27755 [Polyangiaceae bacterium]|nr:hypothetical protein [Polyangiaceae bacterium]